MNKDAIARLFAITFKQANYNLAAQTIANWIRFMAIALVILAVMCSVNHFMTVETRQAQDYLQHLGSRLIRLVIGLMLFILVLNV